MQPTEINIVKVHTRYKIWLDETLMSPMVPKVNVVLFYVTFNLHSVRDVTCVC